MGRSYAWGLIPLSSLFLLTAIPASIGQQSPVVIPEPPGFAAALNSPPMKAPTVVIPKPVGVVNAPIHDDVISKGSPQTGPQPAKAEPPRAIVRPDVVSPSAADSSLVGKTFSGVARVIDGNTITIAGQSIVLHGADAPEIGQYCNDVVGMTWDCGGKATQHLAKIVSANMVRCVGVEPVPSSIAATCTSNGEDISRRMILDGYAVVPSYLSPLYAAEQSDSQSNRRGLWNGSFSKPWNHRAHP